MKMARSSVCTLSFLAAAVVCVPRPASALAPYAADLTYIVLESGHINCFAKNEYSTMKKLGSPMVLQSGSCL